MLLWLHLEAKSVNFQAYNGSCGIVVKFGMLTKDSIYIHDVKECLQGKERENASEFMALFGKTGIKQIYSVILIVLFKTEPWSLNPDIQVCFTIVPVLFFSSCCTLSVYDKIYT